MTVLNVDFTDVESGAGYLPAGTYRARVKSIEVKAGQTITSDMFQNVNRVRQTLEPIGTTKPIVVYGGSDSQKRQEVTILPWDGIDQHDWTKA